MVALGECGKNTLDAARRTIGADFPPRRLADNTVEAIADLAHQAVRPRPGRTAPRAAKRSGTGYRTLRPGEPPTSRANYTINLMFLHRKPQPDGPLTSHFRKRRWPSASGSSLVLHSPIGACCQRWPDSLAASAETARPW